MNSTSQNNEMNTVDFDSVDTNETKSKSWADIYEEETEEDEKRMKKSPLPNPWKNIPKPKFIPISEQLKMKEDPYGITHTFSEKHQHQRYNRPHETPRRSDQHPVPTFSKPSNYNPNAAFPCRRCGNLKKRDSRGWYCPCVAGENICKCGVFIRGNLRWCDPCYEKRRQSFSK